MISYANSSLKTWVDSVVDGVEVTFDIPVDLHEGESVKVFIYPLEIMDCPQPKDENPPPLQYAVRFLISASSSNTVKAHDAVSDLFFSAMEVPGYEIQFTSQVPGLWSEIGIAPRPAFFLKMPIRRDRKPRDARMVLEPLHMHFSDMRRIRGTLLAENDTPIAGAVVKIPSISASANTDSQGVFEFPAVPVNLKDKSCTINTKGKEYKLLLNSTVKEGKPLVIKLRLGGSKKC